MFNSVEYESGGSTIVVFWYGYGNLKRKLPYHLLQKPNQKKELKNNARIAQSTWFSEMEVQRKPHKEKRMGDE